MKKFLIILPLIFLSGCEFRYRYECQDPLNWGKAMCNNDECKAEGSCTTDVLGFTPEISEKAINGQPSDLPPKNQKFAGTGNQRISNSDCKSPAAANTFKPSTNTFRGSQQNQQQNSFKPNLDAIKRPKSEDDVVGSAEEYVERPLTMNTIVETEGHNRATKINNW
jgi:hypothetical protein